MECHALYVRVTSDALLSCYVVVCTWVMVLVCNIFLWLANVAGSLSDLFFFQEGFLLANVAGALGRLHRDRAARPATPYDRYLFFLGKTVFLLTGNLHGRTRRRRENTKAEARGAKGAAARHARPTHAGAG